MATIEERMTNVDLALDDFESRNSLPPCAPPGTEEELNEYLNMSLTKIKNIQSAECAEIAYRLAQFSTYVQRLVNIERARLVWAQAAMNDTVSPLLGQYDKYMKHENKIALMAKEVGAVSKLKDIMRYTNQRMGRLEDLADRIYKQAQFLDHLRRERVSARYVTGADHE